MVSTAFPVEILSRVLANAGTLIVKGYATSPDSNFFFGINFHVIKTNTAGIVSG